MNEHLRWIKSLIENCPEVGEIYDQQHADTQMRAIIMLVDLINATYEGAEFGRV